MDGKEGGEGVKTYKLGSGSLYHESDDCYCVLGVYLREKHPDLTPAKYEEISSEDNPAGDGYAYLADNCMDDVKAMSDAIAKYEKPEWRQTAMFPGYVNHVYRANDTGAPLAIIEEALAAVGIKVSLEDHRSSLARSENSFWNRYRAKAAED